ncbi:MAG TPA: hypothetical protein PK977_03720 [Chitinophagaceae bacterium]|nr:hypothetical protein [Chitinophagaceae bacterium]HRF17245.1 hypothetical protein [Chitinophagaceae bacterium]
MKKILATGFLMLLLTACNSDKKKDTGDKGPAVVTGKTEATPIGTYVTKEDGKQMEFTLQADGKGFEIYGTEKRPFTWESRVGKIFFRYDGEATEFELPLDAAKGEIRYGALLYKKQ